MEEVSLGGVLTADVNNTLWSYDTVHSLVVVFPRYVLDYLVVIHHRIDGRSLRERAQGSIEIPSAPAKAQSVFANARRGNEDEVDL